jgi:NAD dependent epimerase/dehydratase family enzyme
MSWIHEVDMNRLFVRGLDDPQMQGVYIASSPNPVPQREFMQALRQAYNIPIGLPAPEWLVRIGAPLVMKTDPELALYGRYVISQRLKEEGFEFKFPKLEASLLDLLSS